ncbi:MAG: dTMP kinase [Acidobacteriales bacterium]|nr:dTMP kinase [Terriglobales bacterium]
MTERRGLFLNFEGMDGCGKTTQARMAAERLRKEGYEVLESVEPGGTPIGQQVRRILLDPANEELAPRAELLLYFACRAQNVEQWVKPALDRGAVVVTDRFTDSTMAYQGYGRGLGREIVITLDRIACQGVAPDLTIIVDIDLETSLARARARNRTVADNHETRMDEQAAEFYRRVRAGYQEMVQLEPHRFAVVDGRGDIDTVARGVWQAIQGKLPRHD